MTKELYFADTIVSVKYNKTLPLRLYESIQHYPILQLALPYSLSYYTDAVFTLY